MVPSAPTASIHSVRLPEEIVTPLGTQASQPSMPITGIPIPGESPCGDWVLTAVDDSE